MSFLTGTEYTSYNNVAVAKFNAVNNIPLVGETSQDGGLGPQGLS